MYSLDEFALQAGLPSIDRGLLRRALTHRSYINEHPNVIEDNERLEYLGDAALDFLTAAWLYRRFPEMDEGGLTRLRSALVRTEQLAAFATKLNLGEAVLLGHGEEGSGGRKRVTLLCDVFEALIGALYLDSGIDAVWEFTEPLFEEAIAIALEDKSLLDARSKLQIWAQARYNETPRYGTVDSFGPDHARRFLVEVTLSNGLHGFGQGRSKQEAAQKAASDVMAQISQNSKISKS